MDVNFAKKNNGITLNDSGRKIKITEEILNLFERYRQVGKKTEAGGILIGREDKDTHNLIIEYATFPLKEDIRKSFRFYRKDKGHLDFYNKIYNENNGIYAYVGEWHTHPEKFPTPSLIDKNNWKKIWYKKGNGDLFNVIVGTEEIRVWKCNGRNKISLIQEMEIK